MSSPLTKIRTGDTQGSPEPRVLALDGTDTDDVFEALSSGTRRKMLELLYGEASTPSELAEATDTSLQNVHYHIEKLADVDLVEAVGTRYSEKGAEMSVYAPTSDPLVVVEGEEERTEMESRLKRMVGGISTIVAGSLVAQFLLGSRVTPGGSGDGGEAMMTTETVEESAQATPGVFDAIANVAIEPGAMILLGGVLALVTLELVYRRG